MAFQFRRIVRLLIGRATDYVDRVFDDTNNKDGTVEEYTGNVIKIAAGGTQVVDLGGLSVIKHMYIQSDCQVKYTLSGGSDKIPLGDDSSGNFSAYLETSATSLSLFNSTAQQAIVNYALGGE